MSRERLDEVLRKPVVVAPMAGGPSTPDLVVAAAGAGALGFLAAGYQSGAAMVAQMAQVRAATREAFGVNVFLPGAPAAHPERTAAYLESLGPDAAALGATLGDPAWDDDDWTGKILALLQDPPAIVSFTFGCPPPDVIASFQDADAAVAVSVTTPEEAQFAAHEGADCLVVQGSEAGAHRATFSNDDSAGAAWDLRALSAAVAQVTDLPQIAAGGIMDAEAAAGLLAGPVLAVQCGTAFVRCPESGAHPVYKAALGDMRGDMRGDTRGDGRFTETAVTRAFSGRPARGLANAFMAAHPDAPAAYPEINNATRPLRAAAAKAGDPDRMSLWAGTGFRAATTRPAAEVVDLLTPRRRARP
jgi:nitronate monooxygenase